MDFIGAVGEIFGNGLDEFPFMKVFISCLFVCFVIWLILTFVFDMFHRLGRWS